MVHAENNFFIYFRRFILKVSTLLLIKNLIHLAKSFFLESLLAKNKVREISQEIKTLN
jgi:hypothetical protein